MTGIKSPRQEHPELWKILETVPDPEVPVISVVDLGIIRNATVQSGIVTITITPTYSGCPAMQMIEDQIRQAFHRAGYEQVQLKTVLSPAWTTDWMSEKGKAQLKEFGITPPQGSAAQLVTIGSGHTAMQKESIPCPYCDSTNTKKESEFGPTACKALYSCKDCRQPFEYFKPH